MKENAFRTVLLVAELSADEMVDVGSSRNAECRVAAAQQYVSRIIHTKTIIAPPIQLLRELSS